MNYTYETPTWVLLDLQYPSFLQVGQELSTSLPIETFATLEGLQARCLELELAPEAYEGLEAPESRPLWDAFNYSMLNDPDFNAMFAAVSLQAPVLTSSLAASLLQVSEGKYANFQIIWSSICQVGNASAESLLKWETYAKKSLLPEEFVNIIKLA